MSRWICLSIVIISVISNSNKFFEYYSEEKIKVEQYCWRLGDQGLCPQEIPDNFYIAGARNISNKLSTVTWKWMEVRPTPLRLNKTYSQVRKYFKFQLRKRRGFETGNGRGAPIPLFYLDNFPYSLILF